FAIDVLHGEKRRAVGITDIEDAANVGMGNLPRNPNFRVKTGECRSILSQRLRKEFDGDSLTQRQIIRPIDLAHAPAADQRNNSMPPAANLPGNEPPPADRIRTRQPAGWMAARRLGS